MPVKCVTLHVSIETNDLKSNKIYLGLYVNIYVTTVKEKEAKSHEVERSRDTLQALEEEMERKKMM